MKQIGLAVHNFASAKQDGLPPLDTVCDQDHPGRATQMPLLYPYLEQQALYDTIMNWRGGNGANNGIDSNLASTAADDTGFWRHPDMTNAMRKSFSSVPFLKCPSRRTGVAGTSLDGAALPTTPATVKLNGVDIATRQDKYGPLKDYCPVIYTTFGTYDCDMWFHVGVEYRSGTNQNYAPTSPNNKSAFRRATTENGDAHTWQPQDTFSRWKRGTSNQLIYGEKHIPAGGTGGDKIAFRQDMAFLGIGYNVGGDYEIGRPVCANYPLARPGDVPVSAAEVASHFGSWHPGVCQFLLGDGSVHGVSVTVPGELLGKMANVDNMEAVTLP